MPIAEPSVRSSCRPVRNDPHPAVPPNPAQPIRFTDAGKRRPRLLLSPESLQELKGRLRNPVEAEMVERQRQRLEKIEDSQQPPGDGQMIKDRGMTWWQAP